jgi:hypothetical protein
LSRPILTFVAVVGVLTALAVLALYRHLESVQAAESAWMRLSFPGRTLALSDDLDPDGDARDLFSDIDADGDGIGNASDIVAHANQLLGRRSDPLMGQYDNLLGRIGFLVCVDVVVESWLAAGLSLPALLREVAEESPVWFSIRTDNDPHDPNFVRRVRNYRDLFEHHPNLMFDDHPAAGDLAFYGRNHVALVTQSNGSTYTVIEAFDAQVTTRSGREVEARSRTTGRFGRLASP